MDNTLDLIKDYLNRHLDNPPEELTLDTRLDTLGVDSLGVIELMFEFEDKYGVRVSNDTAKPETVGQLMAIFERLKPVVPVNE